MAAAVGYDTPEALLQAYLNDPDTQEFLLRRPDAVALKRHLYHFYVLECVSAGKDIHAVLGEGALSEEDLLPPELQPMDMAPHMHSPLALHTALALHFANAEEMLAAHTESGMEFWAWVNAYAHTIGVDVHAALFGDSHETPFDAARDWEPGMDEEEEETA